MLIQKFTTLFKDVTRQGTKIPKEEYLTHGKNIIIDQGQDIIAGYTNCEDGIFKKIPAIVFGDHTRIIKYVDTPFFLGADGVKVLKCTDKNANYRYLYYALKNAHIPNTGYNRHFKWLKEITINYPDKNKQNDIVNILDKLEYIIKIRSQELDKFDELIKARFVEMFGDPINNSKNWKLINIKKCCVDILGGGTPSKSHPEFFTGSVPWVTPKDMKENVITDSKDHITYEAISNSSAKLIPSNSVLMVIRSGILKHTLPVAINKNEVTINQDMKAFVPTSEISPIFLENYFIAISPDILSKVRSVTADNINFKSFQKRKIILPPISLQNEFANFVQQVDKSKVAVQKSLEETQTLFDSLMQKYFS